MPAKFLTGWAQEFQKCLPMQISDTKSCFLIQMLSTIMSEIPYTKEMFDQELSMECLNVQNIPSYIFDPPVHVSMASLWRGNKFHVKTETYEAIMLVQRQTETFKFKPTCLHCGKKHSMMIIQTIAVWPPHRDMGFNFFLNLFLKPRSTAQGFGCKLQSPRAVEIWQRNLAPHQRIVQPVTIGICALNKNV